MLEQAAILYNSKKSGILELGGGVPKNTFQQTGPTLDQILDREDGGQDYIIQITDADPIQGGFQEQHYKKERVGAKFKMLMKMSLQFMQMQQSHFQF